jgi:colanic acid/amylovoran biosynthesis protein
MDDRAPRFILAGNNPYDNRGCEAIVRGTTKILRDSFPDPEFLCISHFQNDNQYRIQCEKETDKAITHLSARRLKTKADILRTFWKPESMYSACQHIFNRDALYRGLYRDMIPYLPDARAVLSVGGDNYSLDYGVPTLFTALDDIVLAHKKILVIWGASVGPFSQDPGYEQYMSGHLRKVTGIFARESGTIKYLENIGVTGNVYPVADPAFLMDPVKPPGTEKDLELRENAIGLNLSPLMARFVAGGNMDTWVHIAASIVENLSEMTDMPLYLIPHVTTPHDNDYAFLQNVISIAHNKYKVKGTVTLVPPHYNAAETKWIISQMALLVGARTHATIAGFSSDVPTLSLAYSTKARGINQDIFGHTRYCLDPSELDRETISGRVKLMLDELTGIRRGLEERIPAIQRSALSGGSKLKKLIRETQIA